MTAASSPANSAASHDYSAAASSGAAVSSGIPAGNRNLRLTWKAVITGQACLRKLWNQYHEALASENEDAAPGQSDNNASSIMPMEVPAVMWSNN